MVKLFPMAFKRNKCQIQCFKEVNSGNVTGVELVSNGIVNVQSVRLLYPYVNVPQRFEDLRLRLFKRMESILCLRI